MTKCHLQIENHENIEKPKNDKKLNNFINFNK